MKEESPREEAIWTRGVSYSKLHNNLCPLFHSNKICLTTCGTFTKAKAPVVKQGLCNGGR